MNLRRELEERISLALAAAGAPEGTAAMVAPTEPQFGDYKASGVMAAAKRARLNPRELATKVVAELGQGGASDLSELAESIEIAGPGFINIKIKSEWLAGRVADTIGDERLGVPQAQPPQNIVVDYSAPNLAKEMHVGHLRSTIIGDALARTLELQGQNVIRQNHVGDWGTQFGMLITYLKQSLIQQPQGQQAAEELGDLEEFYRKAKQQFDSDPAFAEAAREEVVRLQGGDVDTLEMWHRFLEISLRHCEAVYGRLGVGLNREHLKAESSYNADLPTVISDLASAGLLKESQGAMCVFLPQFVAKDGTPLPLIVQKSDEGYLYATTDLAAIRYRVGQLHADRVLYVVDARQSLHFQMVFATARAAGFAPESVSLEHVAFGTMMGADGKPFKTRTGGTVKLMDLLDEAVKRAMDLVTQKNADDVAKGKATLLSEADKQGVAEAVGIGAVKYADLAQNRNSDYVFSWDKMLAMDGNTAPYMQYAYARIKSIFRKDAALAQAAPAGASGVGTGIMIQEPAERALALKLLQFPETVAAVASECLPSILCGYLYDLAGTFTAFYEHCPVLKSAEPVRSSRLLLCEVTAATIRKGLELLGIATIEQM